MGLSSTPLGAPLRPSPRHRAGPEGPERIPLVHRTRGSGYSHPRDPPGPLLGNLSGPFQKRPRRPEGSEQAPRGPQEGPKTAPQICDGRCTAFGAQLGPSRSSLEALWEPARVLLSLPRLQGGPECSNRAQSGTPEAQNSRCTVHLGFGPSRFVDYPFQKWVVGRGGRGEWGAKVCRRASDSQADSGWIRRLVRPTQNMQRVGARRYWWYVVVEVVIVESRNGSGSGCSSSNCCCGGSSRSSCCCGGGGSIVLVVVVVVVMVVVAFALIFH